MEDRYQSFAAFYPFYLTEHTHPVSRRLHVIGTGLMFGWVIAAAGAMNPWLLIGAPLTGYGFAWVGHFFFERNTPATFKYPLWSLMGDIRLFSETVTGKRKF